MGIMERRYYNWDEALQHFTAAQNLSSSGFCEPLYWIGITRINAGEEVSRGAQVLLLLCCNAWPSQDSWYCLKLSV